MKQLKPAQLALIILLLIQTPLLAQSNAISAQLGNLLFTGDNSSKDIIRQLESTQEKTSQPSIYQTVEDDDPLTLPIKDSENPPLPKQAEPSKIEAMFIEDTIEPFTLKVSTMNTAESIQDALDSTDPDLILSRQLMIENQSLKKQLATQNFTKQFGYEIFEKNKSEISFATVDVPIGADYLLGPGDKLNIYIWGKIEETLELEVDHRGQIYLPSVGKVSLMGARYGDAQKIIEEALGKEFVNFNVSVTIKEL